MLAILMSPLPVRVLFHPYIRVVALVILVSTMLTSPICVAPIPFGLSPSTHATYFLFLPFYVSLSTLAHLAFHVVTSFPL